MMLPNYVKTAGRNMGKRKLLSFINAFGLSIGIAFCILIYLFIRDELSYDQFHVNKDHIYRLEEKSYFWKPNKDDSYEYTAYLQAGLGPKVKEEIPQVKYMTRFNSGAPAEVTYGDKTFSEKIAFIDPDFFQMFSFPVLAGTKEEFLTDRYHVVITQEMAKKYFGKEEPVGKVLSVDYVGIKEYKVVGVIANAPKNSSLKYGLLVSQENMSGYQKMMESWRNFSTPTFLQLYSNADLATFQDNMKKLGMELNQRRKEFSLPDDQTLGEYQFTNLKNIHLNTRVSWQGTGDPQYSFILSGIAILILVIACINYISLALTAYATRKTEVGVRKVIGAHRGQLIKQFLFESVLLTLISTFISLVLVLLFLPSFNEFTKKDILLSWPVIIDMIVFGLGIAVMVGLISGCYPAFFLSGFKPALVLKGGFTSKLKAGFTQPLVVLQFAMSAFLIISSVIMYRQMEYITTKDLGYDQEHVIVFNTQAESIDQSNKLMQQLRNRLLQQPEVVSVTGTNASFNRGGHSRGFIIDGEMEMVYVYTVDPYYLQTLDISLTQGRNFNENNPSDSNAIIVNETLVADFRWNDPLNEYLSWKKDSLSQDYRIIGVAKDYHFRSLEMEIGPVILTMSEDHLFNVLVKLHPGDLSASVEKVQAVWSELYPDKPFDYRFLDQDIARQYEAYQRWMKITGLSTLFAILISCLGLFGLAGINALNRTKEIGIRKVFGAKLSTIIYLLNKQYVVLAIIAFAIATPLSWHVMHQWMANFQYGISISWHIFVLSMVGGLLIALLTVSYHAIKSASINPTETLKYE